MNVRARDPVGIFLELVSRINRVESAEQKQRNRKFRQRHRQRDPPNPGVIVRAQQQKRRHAE